MKNITKNSISKDSVANSKIIITLDKLIITANISQIIFDLTKISNNMYLQEILKQEAFDINSTYSNAYHKYFKVFYKDIYVATIFYKKQTVKPYNSIIEIKNETFYTVFDKMFHELLDSKLNLKDVIVNKVDIALDDNKSHMNRLFDIYTLERGNLCYFKGKRLIEEKRKRGSYYIGGNWDFNIYDKLKIKKKAYIKNYYIKNGFLLENGVTRTELRLKKTTRGELRELLEGINIRLLIDKKYLERIIRTAIDLKLVVIDTKTKSEKPLIDFNFANTIDKIKFSKATLNIGMSKQHIITKIKTLTYEWETFFNKNTNSDIYILIQKLIKKYNLQKWFSNFRDFKNYKDFNKKKEAYIKKYYEFM